MNIDKMRESVKQEDFQIIENEPLVLHKYGRTLKLYPVKWRKWEEFSYHMAMFCRYYYLAIGNVSLPEDEQQAKDFATAFRKIMTFKKPLKHVLKMAKLSGLSRWWIKRNFTIFDFAELFAYMYLANVEVVKKNLKIVLSLVMPAQLR